MLFLDSTHFPGEQRIRRLSDALYWFPWLSHLLIFVWLWRALLIPLRPSLMRIIPLQGAGVSVQHTRLFISSP
jgi:hypothetical protein